jgi:1-deoxy-D-xylulose-5-phosphate synthase
VTHAIPTIDQLGVPQKFIAHGKPDRILAKFGLDADGIEKSVRSAIDRLAERVPTTTA